MKALSTLYRGTRFRSRLEADWAATMDARGLLWDYEPEGYVLDDGTCHSPDFWLPTARAWLEVKGSHMQRITKVHDFAAQLWRESGATSTYDLEAPMVLVGYQAEPHALLDGESHAPLIGTMGDGKAYSVAIVTCPACDAATVIALWQPTCRNCRYDHGNGPEAWMDTVVDHWWSRFQRVVRPAGRGR